MPRKSSKRSSRSSSRKSKAGRIKSGSRKAKTSGKRRTKGTAPRRETTTMTEVVRLEPESSSVFSTESTMESSGEGMSASFGTTESEGSEEA